MLSSRGTAPVWADFYRPLGLADSMVGVFERSSTTLEVAMFGMVGRSFTPDERKLVSERLPHLSQSWRVRRALEHWQHLAAGLASALDELGRGIVITTSDGVICHASCKADELLRAGRALTATRGRVGAAGAADTQGLWTGRITDDSCLTGSSLRYRADI